MAKSLPDLVSSVMSVGYISQTSSDISSFEKNINKTYLIGNELPLEKKIDKTAEIISGIASKLDKIDSAYTAGFDFNLEKYFETGDVPSLFEHSFRTKKGPNTPNFKIIDAASVFKEIAKSDGEATIGINCDFFVPEFRDAEQYFLEYFKAFHNAHPYTEATRKWNEYSPGQKVDVVKHGNKLLRVSNEGVVDCEEWIRIFENQVKPEMEKKIERTREVILAVYNKFLSEKTINFLSYSSVFNEHMKSSISRNLKEFIEKMPDLLDIELFGKLGNYPTLTLSRNFEYKAGIQKP